VVNIKSVYFPNSCLQGTELPASFLWDKDKNYKILIEVPENVTLSEIYNVPEDGIEIEGNSVLFKKFENNGYLGLVFETKKNASYSLSLKFKYTIFSEEEKAQVYEKYVSFFRPSIESIKIPEKIKVTFDKNYASVDKKILLHNRGEGTGIVKLKIKDDSDFKKGKPEETKEFVDGFKKDLVDGFNSLKEEYPSYENYLIRLTDYLIYDYELDEKNLKEYKEFVKELSDIINNDEEFAESFFQNYLKSYLKNVYLITPYESFVSYLKSIECGNVIIKDPIDVLTFHKNKGILKGKLEITDLNMNAYDPIDLGNIEIELENVTEFPIQVPIYCIFNWE
jgi:hypothetical protein